MKTIHVDIVHWLSWNMAHDQIVEPTLQVWEAQAWFFFFFFGEMGDVFECIADAIDVFD